MSADSGHERIYRHLLRAYPAAYRAEYGKQMVQLFSDQRRDDGPARTWLKAIRELPATALAEHFRGAAEVGRTSRILGLLGVIAGALILAGFLGMIGLQFSPDLFNLRLVAYNLGVVAVVLGVHMRQAGAGPRLSAGAAVAVAVTNVAYSVMVVWVVAKPGEVGPGSFQPILLTTAITVAMWISDAWFGAVTWKLGVLNRWSAAALFVGSLAALAGMSNWGLAGDQTVGNILLVGIALHGVAWILLGAEVALRGSRTPAAATA